MAALPRRSPPSLAADRGERTIIEDPWDLAGNGRGNLLGNWGSDWDSHHPDRQKHLARDVAHPSAAGQPIARRVTPRPSRHDPSKPRGFRLGETASYCQGPLALAPTIPHFFSLCSASPPALPASSGSPRMTGSTPSELLDKDTQALAAADPSAALLQFLPARLASMHHLPPPPRGSLSGLLDCAELPVDRDR